MFSLSEFDNVLRDNVLLAPIASLPKKIRNTRPLGAVLFLPIDTTCDRTAVLKRPPHETVDACHGPRS